MIKKILFFLLIFTSAVQAQLPANAGVNLIPLPQKIVLNAGVFQLKSAKAIVVDDQALDKEAKELQSYLKGLGLNVPIKATVKTGPAIVLQLGKVEAVQNVNEAYHLLVSPQKVVITGESSAGVYYGLQSLMQLAATDGRIKACQITDWPAFSWRGYMIDGARNFMPMDLLKQQIDVMARYKLNIFHFHFTEDIAWRLESKLYPQLTDPETMLRNKAEFYTEKDLKELISYCKDRHITLVPEIDMPGHSAAFKRAMKVDMQSDSGLVIVKNIIKEFCSTYDVPYLHIGADEVKITNNDFLPEVISLIEKLGKKVIGWEPGGNFTESTIRQLWMEGATKVSANKNIKYIDSRHLYINHMDPLESVVTIFNRRICNLDQGNEAALGGIICTWPDRRVNKPEDVLVQNPVYPAMLAFSERSWRGGGVAGWLANVGAAGTAQAKTFAEFENRLMVHQSRYFSQLPFPYAKQSTTTWRFYGPFKNEGELSKGFEPENKTFYPEKQLALTAIGGTLILRHWWAPLVKGLIDQPEENTTWYASTKIWSDKNEPRDFWIGFNNLSRSYASDSPDAGTWDNRGSVIWVNDQVIKPPMWKNAGMPGDMERPLIDEGYEYRAPNKIVLRKGWNTVLVKLPIGSFKGKDWKNPEKWMFTFVSAGI